MYKFDFECSYVNHTSTNTNYAKLLKYCMKIASIHMTLPKTNTVLQRHTAYDTLTNEYRENTAQISDRL